jgi:hypothetical protein
MMFIIKNEKMSLMMNRKEECDDKNYPLKAPT